MESSSSSLLLVDLVIDVRRDSSENLVEPVEEFPQFLVNDLDLFLDVRKSLVQQIL